MSTVLSAFGWASSKNQKGFLRLLKTAKVNLPTWDLSKNQNDRDIVLWILTLIEETQNKFWNRQGGKERWEVNPAKWMENDIQSNFKILKKLSFVKKVVPFKGAKGVVCVLGATKERMLQRLNFLTSLIQHGYLSPDKIVLLSGERLAVEGKDGNKKELSQLASQKGKTWNQVTEMDILEGLYAKNKNLSQFKSVSINVASHNNKRPTTQSTVEALLLWLGDNPCSSIFFISNQPYVSYQNAVIQAVFEAHEKKDINIQTLGEEFPHLKKKTAQTMKPLYEALASFLWGKTLSILRSMNLSIPPVLQARFETLFTKDQTFSCLLNNLKL